MDHKTAEQIDAILQEMECSENNALHKTQVSSALLNIMEEHDLIETEQNDQMYYLTSHGHEVLEQGGCVHLLEQQKKEEKSPDFFGGLLGQLEDMMADESNQKQNFKKIKKTTFAWLFGLALAGMFLAYLTR